MRTRTVPMAAGSLVSYSRTCSPLVSLENDIKLWTLIMLRPPHLDHGKRSFAGSAEPDKQT